MYAAALSSAFGNFFLCRHDPVLIYVAERSMEKSTRRQNLLKVVISRYLRRRRIFAANRMIKSSTYYLLRLPMIGCPKGIFYQLQHLNTTNKLLPCLHFAYSPRGCGSLRPAVFVPNRHLHLGCSFAFVGGFGPVASFH